MPSIMSEFYKYAIQAILTIMIMLGGLIILKHNQPPTIVKVNIVAITTHYTMGMLKNGISGVNSVDTTKITNAIKFNLEPIIDTYAKSHNVIVVQSQALVAGDVPDISDYVISQLDKKL
jgi:hypothetical protein